MIRPFSNSLSNLAASFVFLPGSVLLALSGSRAAASSSALSSSDTAPAPTVAQTPPQPAPPPPVQTPPVQTPPAPAPHVPPSPAPVASTPADAQFEAAATLKRKAAYPQAAAAFDEYARSHPGEPRAAEALNEAGVCWFSVGRSQMKLGRNTPESLATYDKALGFFARALETGSIDQGGRAQYMRGWVKFSMDDPSGAEIEYQQVLDKWKSDAKYVPKALERRAMARRNLLETAASIADLQRYVKEYPQGDDIESAKRYLQYCKTFEKPAPPLVPQTWVQGDPITLQAMRGDVVILLFFATWCPHCEEARPGLIDLFDRYESMGVHMIGIVDDSQGQTVDSVRALLPVKGYRFPVMFDKDKRTFGGYRGSTIPDIVLIDRSGRIRWHDNPSHLCDATIEALLLEEPPAAGAPKPAK